MLESKQRLKLYNQLQDKKLMITAFKDIKKIIEDTQEPEGEIIELDFSSVKIFRFTDKIKSMVEKCQKMTIFKLCECELNSLEKLPELDIVSLDVSINKYFFHYKRLKDADLEHLGKYQNLSILNLSDNFIQNLSALQFLAKCTQLKDLELAGNQIEKLPNYRQEVFKQYFLYQKRLKSLELLDKLDRQGQPPMYDSYSDDQLSEEEEGDQDQDQNQDQDQDEDEEDKEEQESQDESEKYQTRRKYHKKDQSQSDN